MANQPLHRLQGIISLLALVGVALAGPPALAAQEQGAPQEGFTVPGTVTDAEDGAPLQYAVVGIPELRSWGLSEADGSFSLQVANPGVYQLVVVKRGWYLADAEVNITGPQPMAIKLYKEQDDNPVGPGRLVGRVFEEGSGRSVSNARIRVTPTGREARTDSRGRFIISGISSGAILLEVEARRGGLLRTDTLAAFPGLTLAVEIGVPQDESAKPRVTVEVWPQFLEAVGFYRRAEQGRGNRFGRKFLEEQRSNSQFSYVVESAVPALRAEMGRWGQRVITTRGTGGDRCALGIWLDNSPMPGFDVDTYPVEWIEAFETYERFDVPPEYRDPCGVLLIWSRRPE